MKLSAMAPKQKINEVDFGTVKVSTILKKFADRFITSVQSATQLTLNQKLSLLKKVIDGLDLDYARLNQYINVIRKANKTSGTALGAE